MALRGLLLVLLRSAPLVAAVLQGCTAPELDGVTFSCQTDADCLDGEVCGDVNGILGCIEASTDPIRIGLSAPLQGPSRELGIEMRRGIEALFARVNREGGVHGRPMELESRNDNYDPELAHQNMLELLDIEAEVPEPDQPDRRGARGVFAVLGNVGTPTMLRTAPIATKNRVIYFAPFTGAQAYLRDGTNSPYVYNYRAGYYQELEAMVDYLATYRQPRVISDPPADSYRRIIAFTQRDSYGDAGYNGLVNAYNRISPLPQPDSSQANPSIVRLYYERDVVSSVDPAIAQAQALLTDLLGDGTAPVSVAILMVDTYQPANKFIRAIKDWLNADAVRATQLDVLFMNVSFVGSDALAAALISAPESYVDIVDGVTRRAYAQGVMVTQVVPYYDSQATGIRRYREDLAQHDGGSLSFTSLEGYIAASLFVDAIELNGQDLTTSNLLRTLDNDVRNRDVGIGTLLSFSSTNHQASHTIWGSVIQPDGKFQVPFTWDPENKVRPN